MGPCCPLVAGDGIAWGGAVQALPLTPGSESSFFTVCFEWRHFPFLGLKFSHL